MSTTGYSIAILIYSIFWLEKMNVKKGVSFILILLPAVIYLFSLDFMAQKIQEKTEFEELSKSRMSKYEYNESTYDNEYLGSLDRFESAYFDWMNFQHEPLLGYGRNNDYSWFRKEISLNFELTGGLVKTFSQYGAFVGVLLYVILFFSSFKISKTFLYQRSLAFALTLLLCSVSYVVFSVPIFTAFWLYGIFCNKERQINRIVLINWLKLIIAKKRLQQGL